MNDARTRTLIAVEDFAGRIASRPGVVILDVADELAAAPKQRLFIPGAFAACLATDFSGPPSAGAGKRPLPDVGELQARARRWGVDADSLVVVYDDNGGAQAARAWWTFRWAGFGNVRILDGGLGAWKGAGLPLANAPAGEARSGAVLLGAGNMPTIDADQAAALARDGLLLDARGRAAYVGAPADAGKAATGHIPGAVSAPAGEHIAASGCFKATEDVHARFGELGVDSRQPPAVYCGSGNAAAHLLAALSVVGVEAPLYVGSWSAWSADPARPVAIGPDRG